MSTCNKLVFSDITVQSVHSPINNTSDNIKQYVYKGPVIIIAQFPECHISTQLTFFCSRRT